MTLIPSVRMPNLSMHWVIAACATTSRCVSSMPAMRPDIRQVIPLSTASVPSSVLPESVSVYVGNKLASLGAFLDKLLGDEPSEDTADRSGEQLAW
ncbi:MAG: hypothetical protein WAU42_01910 [Solirubrobacteraceae bacterium]